MVTRGRKSSFRPGVQRSPKSLLHHVQPCFALVQPQVAPVQEVFRSLGSNDLLHPLLTTFGDFAIFDPSPRLSGWQCCHTNATSSPSEGRPNCARQSLASTLSAPRVAATSYCDPSRHANVVTPCLRTPHLNVPDSQTSLNISRGKKSPWDLCL